MNSDVVFQVVKALSKEEQIKLLHKLNEEIKPNFRGYKKVIISEIEAIEYILKTVFRKSKYN